MATISFTDVAPKDQGVVHFNFGNDSFDLAPGETVEVIENSASYQTASSHPWLQVTGHDTSDVEVEDISKSTDTFINPRADHLSSEASPEAIAAAQANQAAINAANNPNAPEQQAAEAEPAAAPETPAAPAPVAAAPTTTETKETPA